MSFSIIIPAYNEAQTISECVQAAHAACQSAGLSDYEILVVDDGSSDDTAALAQQAGARVVASGKRNIGATRNIGVSRARGDSIIFVDADTFINAELLRATAQAFQRGVVCGGARMCWSEKVSWSAALFMVLWNAAAKAFFWPAGSYLFVRRDVFEQAGGFDERLYATEEIPLAKAMKKRGPGIILREPYHTSARKLQQFSRREHIAFFFRFLLSPRKTVSNRKHLDLWYTRRGT